MRRCPHAQTIEAMSYEKGLPSTGRARTGGSRTAHTRQKITWSEEMALPRGLEPLFSP